MSSIHDPHNPTDDIREEAAAWVARSRRPDFDPERGTADLQRWADQSSMHAIALADATSVWDELAGAGKVFLRADQQRRRRYYFAAGVGALAAACAVVFLAPSLSSKTYETHVGAQEQVTLPDGSAAYLNSNTKLSVRFTRGRRSIHLDRGEAFFRVAKNANWPFVVTSGPASTTAVGTEFSVQKAGDVASVILVEGKVLVRLDRTKNPVELHPGQNVNSATAQVLTLTRAAMEKALSWRDGHLVFDNETLESAAAEFNKYTTIPIVIEGSAAAQVRVSGIFNIHDQHAFTLTVGGLYGLKVDANRDRVVISGAPKLTPLTGAAHARAGRYGLLSPPVESD